MLKFILKFRNLFVLLFVVVSLNLNAFTPKISCTKEALPMFHITGQHCQNLYNTNPNDPVLLEMRKVSRENIKNLPDEVYFGSIAIQANKNYMDTKRYNIYNYFFEGITVEAGFAVYETMDSVSIFPSFTNVGPYMSKIIFNWEEEDPETKIIKQFEKILKVSANIVENIDKIDPNDTQIKEIWYEDNGKRDFENKGDIESENYRVRNNGVLVLPDLKKE